jgi:hypothetical protein
MLRAMFDSHPEMAIPPESHIIVSLCRNRREYEDTNGLDLSRFVPAVRDLWTRRWALPERELLEVLLVARPTTVPDAIRTLFSAYASRQGKRRYGERTPGNVLHVAFLADQFPEARFIHLVRDGRDVTMSYLSAGFGVVSVGESAFFWKRAVEQARKDGKRLTPSRYQEVRYEALVENPESTLRELCGVVDLRFSPAMLRYFERPAMLMSARATAFQSLSRPPKKGIRDWRNEMRPQDLALFEAIAGASLERFEYPRALRHVPASARLRARLLLASVGVRRLRRRAAKLRKGSRKEVGRGFG